MSVYDLDLKGIRKTLIEFHQSVYGRTIFFLAYIIPFVLFVVAAVAALLAIFFSFDMGLFMISLNSIVIFFPTFIIGNMYFYSEIRHFCAYRDQSAHRKEKQK